MVALLGLGAAACGSGGDGGGSRAVKFEVEPNDSPAQAVGLGSGRPGRGSLSAFGDVDFWSAELKQGNVIKVELFGARLDHSAWNAVGNVPRLRLWDRDGATVLLEHDASGNVANNGPWSAGKHDLDIPAWKVPADGKYYLSVQSDSPNTVGGDYVLRVRKLDTGLAPAQETEPKLVSGDNDTPDAAQVIQPSLLQGWRVDGEVDWFELELSQTSIAHLEVIGARNGVSAGDDSYLDPRLALFASDGTTLIQQDSDSLFDDPQLDVLLPAGTYLVRVDEDARSGDGAYFLSYRREALSGLVKEAEPNELSTSATSLAIGKIATGDMSAGDVDHYRINGFAGQLVAVQLWDATNSEVASDDVALTLLASDGTTPLPSGGGGGQQFQTTLLEVTGPFFVRVTSDGSPSPTSYHLRTTLLRQGAFESEVNNQTSQADAMDKSRRAAGVIDPPGDLDLFSFTANKGRLVTVYVYAGTGGAMSNGVPSLSGFGSELLPNLAIRDASGNTLAQSYTFLNANVSTEGVVDALPVAAASFVAPFSGKFFAKVSADDGGGGPNHFYLIEAR